LRLTGTKELTPDSLLNTPDHKLISTGISKAKVNYLKGLVLAVKSGELSFRRLAQLSDKQVVAELTRFRGIGPWTAEIYLIFALHRPGIFPVHDAGIRVAMCQIYKIPKADFLRLAPAIADRWRPYRSIASQYLWAFRDAKPM